MVYGREHGDAFACGRCGFGVSVGFLYAKRRTPVFGVPAELVRVLLNRRSMVPAPWIYLAALGLGVVSGVILDAWLGWPWWAVAAVVVAAVWLFFLSSAFTGPAREDALGRDLLDAISPRRASRRRAEREARLLRTRPFPFYGLDASWTGSRMVGGVAFRGNTLTSVELIHGEPMRPPWVQVETEPLASRQTRSLEDVATDLWWGMEQHPPPNLPPAERQAWIDRRIQERRARNTKWTRVSILVEAEPTEFDLLDETSDWAAHGIIGGLVVKLQAHQFPIGSVRLETVTDVEPYIEGSRWFFEEQRKLHE
ncbi:MAG: hypothetical protein ACRDHO_09090, partial [Actinomycetota bacterium]